MPPPKAIVCHICNGKYFKRSFPIHLKQCEEKWKKTHSRCEYCGTAVANHDWSDHRSHCKPKRRGSRKKSSTNHSKNMPLTVPKGDHQQLIPTLANQDKATKCEECESKQANWKCIECEQSLCAICEVDLHKKGARARHTRIPLNSKALQQQNLSIITASDCKEPDNDTSELSIPTRDTSEKADYRVECKFCGRKFNPDRAEKHMKICRVAQKKSKRRRVWDGAKKRVEGTAFAEFQYNRSKTPPIIKEWKKNGRRWKEESNQLREIAAINADIKTMRNGADNKEEKNDITISAPANKPSFRKTESVPTISAVSSISRSGKSNFRNRNSMNLNSNTNKRTMRGNMYNRKSRPQSNTPSVNSNDLSLQGTARKYQARKNAVRNRNMNQDKESKSISTRVSRRNSMTKKPAIPKFEPKKAVMNNRRQSNRNSHNVKTKSAEPTKSVPNIAKKSRAQSRTSDNHNNVMTKRISNAPIEKENNIKKQQPRLRKNKSQASSLSRGLELGMNVDKIFDDKPKTMNDYMERERLRRQNRAKRNAKGSSSISSGLHKKSVNVNKPKMNKVSKPKSSVPGITKKMNRLQIKKEIRIDNQPIGGKRIGKPSNAKDLASKRAAYFESLLQKQEE